MENPTKKSFEIQSESFELLLERSRGVAVFVNKDRSKYLRIGEPAMVEKELGFHKELLKAGFPVARILDEGSVDGSRYWIEESLGEEHFGVRFQREFKESGVISDASFHAFLTHVKQVHDAEERTMRIEGIDFSALRKGVGFDRMQNELPDERERLEVIWGRIQHDLANYPFCPTHGDFSAHNTLERGVIDFGDHFSGPVGFDMITALTAPFWFPKDPSYGRFSRGYDFSDDQIDEYLKEVGTFGSGEHKIDILSKFDSLFILRATWWAVGNDYDKKLQTWRWERYRALIHRLTAGKPLFDYWQENRDL